MAKKTRTELSTLALNTNLPDNTTEQITPTTERSQLTDERESVVNYKDDLGGTTNAGKFLTVATDGESLTMVNEPSAGVPDWVTFLTGYINEMILNAGDPGIGPETLSRLQFKSFDGTKSAQIAFTKTDNALSIATSLITILITDKINFTIGGNNRLRIESDELTNWGSIMSLNAPQFFDASPLYTLKFKGIAANPVAGVYTYEEFANIKGGKENATENDKAGFLSFKTGIADGTLTERLRIASGGAATFSSSVTATGGYLGGGLSITTDGTASNTPSATSANIGVLNSLYAFIDLSTAANQGGWIDFSKGDGSDYSGRIRYENSSDALQFFTNAISTPRLTISSTGYATFTNDIDTPTVRQGGEIMISRGSNIVRVGSGSGSDSLAFYAGGSQRMSIATTGNVVISRTTYSSIQAVGCYDDITANAANMHIFASGSIVRSTSSRKYKKNIQDSTHGINELLKLRSVTYQGTGNRDGKQVLGGLIAEEVHDLGLTEFVQYAEDGTPEALAYGHMISLCVKSIQEQQTIIEDLKARIEKLEL